ncbi:MAG: hypothetical protein O7G83_15430 [Proteobacteria bacterium]|nr:hypothetical protein [Pseudomonadota bacterium]
MIVGFVAAYTLGWILAAYNQMAPKWYYERVEPKPRKFISRGVNQIAIALLRFSVPARSDAIMILLMNLDEAYEIESAKFGLKKGDSPWDMPILYRELVSEQTGEIGRSVADGADFYYKRFLFSMGMAVAFALLTVLAAGRLVRDVAVWIIYTIDDISGVSIGESSSILGWKGVVILLIGAGVTCVALRGAAVKMWESEIHRTACLNKFMLDAARKRYRK